MFFKNKPKTACRDVIPKQYIVFVGRDKSILRSGKAVWDVEIAEIKHVTPRLCETSFCERKSLSLKSWVRMKKNTRGRWFHVPYFHYDLKLLAKKAFLEVYPDEWDRLEKYHSDKLYRTNEKSNSAAPPEEPPIKQEPKDDLDQLKQDIANLNCGDSDDDWEDCYSSD